MSEKKSDTYLNSIENNKEVFNQYYKKSFVKTEQQKFLEELLLPYKEIKKLKIADVACGAGSLSYHLNDYFSDAEFWCSDYSEVAVENMRKSLSGNNFHISKEDIYELSSYPKDFFDFSFCWMTLSWLENAEKALDQLTRITKPGGRIYLSSLFNLEHDVDLFTKIVDHSSNQENEIIEANYYTYSEKTISKWVNQKVRQIKLYPFNPSIDFNYEGRGIGTYTVNTELGKKLQISAGLLMNWAVLEIEK